MGRRVWDGGGSEGHFVTKWIAVEPPGNITARESGQTSTGSFLTRELEEPTDERKQMTAQAGALSHATTEWHALNWEALHRNVRRLQARIVKATPLW